jgi:hypothetical protein
MRKEPVFISLLVVSGACASLARVVVAQTRDDAESARIAGTWRGNSICTVKGSPCHDEINVYRFASVPERAPSFSVTASKVVDGKEVVMEPANGPTIPKSMLWSPRLRRFDWSWMVTKWKGF